MPENPPAAIILAPHQDDESLCCGGTIALLRQNNIECHIVFLTDGSRSHEIVLGINRDPSPKEIAKIRKRESIMACKTLGVDSMHIHHLGAPDGFLTKNIESTSQTLYETTQKITSRIKILFAPHELDNHQDHKAAAKIANLFHAQLPRPCEKLSYITWGSDEDTYTQEKIEIDVTSVLSKKIAAISCYQSQISKLFPKQKKPVISQNFVSKLQNAPHETFYPSTDGITITKMLECKNQLK